MDYIAIPLSFKDSWLWNYEEPFSTAQVYIDLLMEAAIAQSEKVIFTLGQLSGKWHVINVLDILDDLTRAKLITYELNGKNVIIRVNRNGL